MGFNKCQQGLRRMWMDGNSQAIKSRSCRLTLPIPMSFLSYLSCTVPAKFIGHRTHSPVNIYPSVNDSPFPHRGISMGLSVASERGRQWCVCVWWTDWAEQNKRYQTTAAAAIQQRHQRRQRALQQNGREQLHRSNSLDPQGFPANDLCPLDMIVSRLPGQYSTTKASIYPAIPLQAADKGPRDLHCITTQRVRVDMTTFVINWSRTALQSAAGTSFL